MTETVSGPARSSRDQNSLLNALAGGVVSIVLGFLPFVSPVVGGALAGYLQGPDRAVGVRVGGYAGVVAAVPTVGVLLLGASAFAFLPAMGPPTVGGGVGSGAVSAFVVVATLVVSVVYAVTLSAFGGYVGAYLNAAR